MCEDVGSDCPSRSHPYRSGCPEVHFDVSSPGACRRPVCIQRPLDPAPCGATAETKDRGAGSPPAVGYQSIAGREKDIVDSAFCASLVLGTCSKAAGAQEPGSRTSLGRMKGERAKPLRGGAGWGRGEMPQVPMACNLATLAGNRTKRARGGSVPEGARGWRGALNFTTKSYRSLSKEQYQARFSLEASGKLDNRRGQLGGRWFLAWMMGPGLNRTRFLSTAQYRSRAWKRRKPALGKHIGE